jgi:hypothetical protein
MVFSIKVNGKMVYKMEEVLQEEQTVLIFKLDLLLEKHKEVEFIFIQMDHTILANLKVELSMEKENSSIN